MTTLAFDVNETLLDLAALDEPFEARLGAAGLRPLWFQQLLQLAFVGGITGDYVPFPTAGRAALEMVAASAGVQLTDDDTETIVGAMRTLPPHAGVGEALRRLQDAGHRLVAMSNSPLDVLRDQIDAAGLSDHFLLLVSADEVGALKPVAAVYEHAARRAGVPIGELLVVAAHSWDVTGALAAGARAAFVGRAGAVPSPLGPQPELVVADLGELAAALPST